MSDIYDPNADVRHFPAFATAVVILEEHLRSLWSAWVPSELGIPAPRLCIQVRDVSDAFYGHKNGDNTIYLFLMETDIEDIEAEPVRRANGTTQRARQTRGLEWSLTTGQLLHELLHAYQYKVLKEPSPEGCKLFSNSKARFFGPGHDELFYTAIATHAPHFGLTADEFAREL
jgi:hypothetical protein